MPQQGLHTAILRAFHLCALCPCNEPVVRGEKCGCRTRRSQKMTVRFSISVEDCLVFIRPVRPGNMPAGAGSHLFRRNFRDRLLRRCSLDSQTNWPHEQWGYHPWQWSGGIPICLAL